MAKRHVVAGKDGGRQAVHALNNNFAAIGLWLSVLLDSSCEGCRELHERVARAIGRNLADAQGSCKRLRTLQTRDRPRRAAMNGSHRRRAS
jgi:hypothetical protein